MKYDAQLGSFKDQLSALKSVVIALPANLSTDKLAAGLALYLSLKQFGKDIQIVSAGTITVENSNLYGIGKISSTMPQNGGNLIITLENVVAPDGTVPALEKLDWYPEGSNLNLVFHVLSGQKFEPTQVTPKHQGGSLGAVICIGASSLSDLGAIYAANPQAFSGVPAVNIDNSPSNSQFGQVNVVDQQASSLCEIVFSLISSLNLPVDADTASNILAGVYSATRNLTTNVKPDTFITVGQAMQAGGEVSQPQQTTEPQAAPAFSQTPQPPVQQASQTIQGTAPLIDSNNLPQWLNFPSQQPAVRQQPVPPVSQPQPGASVPVISQPQPAQASPEEKPAGEQAYSSNPEMGLPSPDWLTPKIFKGSNLE